VKKKNKLSIKQQCELLEVCRSSFYYVPQEDSSYNHELMKLIDIQYLETPFFGILRMTNYLRELGHVVNPKRIRRLYRLMDLQAIGPRPNTSRPHKGKGHTVYPYLLRNLEITHPNQVWAMDISAPGSDNLSNEISPAVSKPAVEILPRYAREVWRKGAVKFLSVLRRRRNKQNSLKCTEDSPFTVGRATTESMMRQRSMRRKLLYLIANLQERNGLGGLWSALTVFMLLMRGMYNSIAESPHSCYPEPPGVEYAI